MESFVTAAAVMPLSQRIIVQCKAPLAADALPESTSRCPTGAIRWVEGAQFAESEASHV